MTQETRLCLAELATLLDRLNTALHTEVTTMQDAGETPTKIEHVKAGIKAIKDSGTMLLIWADYIARGDLSDPADNEPGVGPDPFPR
jgi:hypothetical protein